MTTKAPRERFPSIAQLYPSHKGRCQTCHVSREICLDTGCKKCESWSSCPTKWVCKHKIEAEKEYTDQKTAWQEARKKAKSEAEALAKEEKERNKENRVRASQEKKQEKLTKKINFKKRTCAQAIKWKEVIAKDPETAGRTLTLGDFVDIGQKANKNRELFLKEHPEVFDQVEIVKGRAITQMFPNSQLCAKQDLVESQQKEQDLDFTSFKTGSCFDHLNTQIQTISNQLLDSGLDPLIKATLRERRQTLIVFREASVRISKKEAELKRFVHQVETLETCEKLNTEEQLRVRVFKKKKELQCLNVQRKIRNYDSDSEVY